MLNEALSLAEASLAEAPLEEAVRSRLRASLTKAWGPEGALTPPQLAWRVAEGLALGDPEGIVAIVGLFYTAVDLSDDVSDGDAERAAIGDPERLLLWLPEAAHRLDPARGPAALRALNRGGLAMWDGQDADLAATGHRIPPGAAIDVARGKAGEEVAAVFSAVAEAAGAPVAPWASLGRPFGVALQLLTDLADFAKGGPDWDARQPAWPLAVALAHPVWGPATQFAWAGDHRHEARRDKGCALMTAALDVDTLVALTEQLEGAARGLPGASLLVDDVTSGLAPWSSRRPPEPELARDPEPTDAHWRALRGARAFLTRDPRLDEAVEYHERTLWNKASVAAPVFGRLLAAWAAREAGLELPVVWAELASVPALGHRYFPEVEEVALDTDLAGWLLTASVGGDEVLQALEEAVPAGLPTWLGPSFASDGTPLTPHPCVASMASASRGLQQAGSPLAAHAWDRTLQLRALVGPISPYYPPVTVDALLIDGAAHCGLDPERVAPAIATFEGGASLSGLVGDVLATAIALPALKAWDRLPTQLSTHRALVDAVASDGGAPAVGAWRTLPLEGRDGWYRSRSLVTAFVLRALHTLPPPELPLPPPAPVTPVRVADV